MNAVEIEQAITDLAERPFDPAEFPYAFLEAFGNKATTIMRLRAGASNKSDLGGVLQTSNIHILTCDAGRVTQSLAALKANLASHNAGVTVVIVGISAMPGPTRRLYSIWDGSHESVECKQVDNINAYLVAAPNIEVQPAARPQNGLTPMQFGNHPYYGAALILSNDEAGHLVAGSPEAACFVRPFYGSKEFIDAAPRACLWIADQEAEAALAIPAIARRVEDVARARRAATKDASARKLADTPWRFREQTMGKRHALIVPRVSSENRPYLPIGLLEPHCVVQEKAFALYDAPLWNLALIASRLHWVWIGTVCVRMRTDFSYSNTLGWNTFPVPTLTEKNKADLAHCAEDITKMTTTQAKRGKST